MTIYKKDRLRSFLHLGSAVVNFETSSVFGKLLQDSS